MGTHETAFYELINDKVGRVLNFFNNNKVIIPRVAFVHTEY